jgi:hypothetical protein
MQPQCGVRREGKLIVANKMKTKSKDKICYPDSYRDRPAAAGGAL